MKPTVLHVFVSSTWLDLQPERAAVETALQRLRETKFVGMEYFGSRGEDTRLAGRSGPQPGLRGHLWRALWLRHH